MLKTVLDSNIILSALFFPKGKENALLQLALDQHKIFFSSFLIRELSDVILRDKFERFAPLEQREKFLPHLISNLGVELIEIEPRVELCRDPNDNHILDLAEQASADFLVTGDKDLLVLEKINDCPIIRASEALTIYQKIT